MYIFALTDIVGDVTARSAAVLHGELRDRHTTFIRLGIFTPVLLRAWMRIFHISYRYVYFTRAPSAVDTSILPLLIRYTARPSILPLLYIRPRLFYLDNGNTEVALSVFAEPVGHDARVALEVRPDRVLERAGAFSVYQAQGVYAGDVRLVEVFVDHIPRVVSEHSAQVDLVLEVARDGDAVLVGCHLLFLRVGERHLILVKQHQIRHLCARLDDAGLNHYVAVAVGVVEQHALSCLY